MKKRLLPIVLAVAWQSAYAWLEIRESNTRRSPPPAQVQAAAAVTTVVAGESTPGAAPPPSDLAKDRNLGGTNSTTPFPLPAATSPAANRDSTTGGALPAATGTVTPPEADRSWAVQPGPLKTVFEQIAARHGFALEWRQGKKSESWETSHPLPLKGKDIKSDASEAGNAINYRQRVVDVTVHEGNKVVEVSIID